MQAAKAGQIDLVIMDVGLPDIDGREASRSLTRTLSTMIPNCAAR